MDSPNQSPSKANTLFQSYGHGKLLLSGEYAVLDGAKALALPTRFGQSLQILSFDKESTIQWTSKDKNGTNWLDLTFSLPELEVIGPSSPESDRLTQIFRAIRQLNPNFLKTEQGIKAETRLEFNREWGLGSSSTLIYSLAVWAEVDPYQLLRRTFGGSGYDIACASAKGPIYYSLQKDGQDIQPTRLSEDVSKELYFTYLGNKMNSREGIAHYRNLTDGKDSLIQQVNLISGQMTATKSGEEFGQLMCEHEDLLSKVLQLPKVKDIHFQDFQGEVKSLGAWGGDFVMMRHSGSIKELHNYLNNKGFTMFFNYNDLIYNDV